MHLRKIIKPSFFLALLLIGTLGISWADPGIGMVIDSKGNLFYTDLKQVWRIGTDDSKTIAVPNVHTHELYLDAQDRLYGEHLWYNGDQQNTWGHYLWQLQKNGSVQRIKDSTYGFIENYSYVRDTAGNQYYLERSIPSQFWKIDPSGSKTLLASKSFSNIGRLHITIKGVLVFTNKGDVYAIPPDEDAELLVKNLGEINTVLQDSSGTIWNIWSDKRSNFYIATGTVIKKIDHRRLVTTIYKSASGWYPVSGCVSTSGDFWVMEYNAANEVRVQKISAAVRKQIATENKWKTMYLPFLFCGSVVLGLYFLFRSKRKTA